MKSTIPFLVVSLLCITVRAADLTLTDGRVLKDATITSQTPRNVTIKHAAGLSAVAKTLLPAELQTQYPVDEVAAKTDEEKNRKARIRAQEIEQAEYQRSLKLQAERAKTAKFNRRAPIETEADRRDRLNNARSEVQSRAEHYFKTEYPLATTAKNIGSLKVSIVSIQPVEGWTNRWIVRGKCEVQYNGEVVKVYPTASKETLDEVNRLNSRGYGYQQTTLDTSPYETTKYSQKSQDFEANYNAETATPTFEINLL